MTSMHSFRIDDEEWRMFVRACSDKSSASTTLREFIRWYNNGCRDQLKVIPPVLFPERPPPASL